MSSPRKRNIFFRGVAIAFVLAGFSYGILENTYVTYPRLPDPSMGRIVPYEVKGIVVFIDENQRLMVTCLKWTQIVGAILAVACLVVDARLHPSPH